MTLPFNYRMGGRGEPESAQSDEAPVDGDADRSSHQNAGEVGRAWRPRLHVAATNAPHDPFVEAARRRQDLRPDQAQQPDGAWSRSEDLNSVERLAAMLEARQFERAHRHAEELPSELPPEESTLAFEDADGDGELGERFGWEDRWTGEDVRQYLEDHDEPAARRWLAPVVRAGAVFAVSAAVAYFIVFPGSSPDQASDQSAAVEEASGDQVAFADDEPSPAQPSGVAETEGQAPALRGSEVPSAAEVRGDETGARGESEEANVMVPASSATVGENIRMIMPAPHQPSDSGATELPAQASEPPAQAPASSDTPVLQPREAAPSWMAPSSAPDEGADAATGGESNDVQSSEAASAAAEPSGVDASARSAGVTQAVNMRAEPDNDGAVLTIIPADASIDLFGCEAWCEVAYDGQQGWVYRSFVAGADAEAATQ